MPRKTSFEGSELSERHGPSKFEATVKKQTETIVENLEPKVSFEEAEKIFGKDFFGIKEIETVFGPLRDFDTVPPIPFSREELIRAQKLGQQLIFQRSMMNVSGTYIPLTMDAMSTCLTTHDNGPLIYHRQDWFKKYPFYTKDSPTQGWRLTSKAPLPDSGRKSFLTQTDMLVKHLTDEVFKNEAMPSDYQAAIDEYKRDRKELDKLAKSRKKQAEVVKKLDALAITRLTREKPIEVMYRLVLNSKIKHERLFNGTEVFTRQSRPEAEDGFVVIGLFDELGMRIFTSVMNNNESSTSNIGACLSRQGIN